MLFLPEFGAAVLTAAPFGALFRTRFTPVLAISGLAVLAAGAALLTGLTAGASALVAVAAALVGFGVGASVSPALFLAGFSLRSAQIQRVFALIELLRGVTAFLVADGGRLQVTDLDRWSAGEPAWQSPPLFGRFRRGRPASARAAVPERTPVAAGHEDRAGGDRTA